MLGVLFALGCALVLVGDRIGSSFLTEMGAVLVVAIPLTIPVAHLMGAW